jgi:hypothetical protein
MTLVFILLFFYVVTYHTRLLEVTSRIDFLWKVKADKEYEEVSETRQYNAQLLKNILPDHVANYFLAPSGTNARKNEVNEYFLD